MFVSHQFFLSITSLLPLLGTFARGLFSGKSWFCRGSAPVPTPHRRSNGRFRHRGNHGGFAPTDIVSPCYEGGLGGSEVGDTRVRKSRLISYSKSIGHSTVNSQQSTVNRQPSTISYPPISYAAGSYNYNFTLSVRSWSLSGDILLGGKALKFFTKTPISKPTPTKDG